MTDKERLEVIERQLNRAEIKRENLDIEDFQNIIEQQLINGNLKWLVKYAREQAERVEELEEEVDRLNGALHYQLSQENIRNEENRKLKYKNKRHREAIRECIERMNAGGAGTRSFVYETLKKALEGEE